MITKATDTHPEIEWEREDIMDTDDHMVYYSAKGTSEDGRKWGATWTTVDGQFDEITDITEE